MKFSGYFNFDEIPPSSAGNGDLKMDGITDSGAAEFGAYDKVLMPPGSHPTPDECVLLVKTQPDQDVDLPMGRTICFVTDEGRPVSATAVAVDRKDGRVAMDITVWEKTE
ncbi:hypothetical protein ACH3Y9_40345 [Streptomyces sp. WSLK1-5]|uniref:Uncharacterized protein n=1 Tax=Streptomyces griseorubiginosus TaxID=67304 RepID=A0A101RMQ0_9ACTN|nr:hypothetical protein [Streptomyces griseorubiginosus]KUN58402.1 hypothetical protein AQJ54_41765 [Streptomyces griseorubiginosus]